MRRQLIGAHRPGAFAELVAVPEKNCIPLPAGLSLVADVNPGRLATAAVWGAPSACDVRADDPAEVARRLTGGADADVAIDAVGNTATRQAAVKAVRAGGTVVLIGLHEAESPHDPVYYPQPRC